MTFGEVANLSKTVICKKELDESEMESNADEGEGVLVGGWVAKLVVGWEHHQREGKFAESAGSISGRRF
jgi:hypothetical protein